MASTCLLPVGSRSILSEARCAFHRDNGMKCRSCRTELSSPVLDLGYAPPSNSYRAGHQLNSPETYLPLRVRFCDECKLVQLEDYFDPQQLFTSDYAYRSSTSQSWLSHVESFSNSAIARWGLNSQSLVMEIGSNDGHLLLNFAEQGIPCLGIEPATEAAQIARQSGIEVVQEFFSSQLALTLKRRETMADLVVANNVLAHVPDINDFAASLSLITKPDGIIVLEFPHVQNIIQYGQFDTIYHEHYSYLSLTSATNVLGQAGLEVFDVEQLKTHGGSLRIYACLRGWARTASGNLDKVAQSEIEAGLLRKETYAHLQEKAEKVKDDLLVFLLNAKREGKRVAAYGAAAKGSTLLNFAGVKPDLIPVVFDAASSKQGKYLPGSHIPIKPPSLIDRSAWDYILILPWNIAEEVVSQLSALVGSATAFVVAIPHLTLLPHQGPGKVVHAV